MHHGRIRVCIYVGHMVVSTVLGPPSPPRSTTAATLSPPLESPHEFSMRLAAHLCRDRPHRHHRPWTKLVNLLTARGFGSGSMVAHMEPAQRICYDNAANDLPWAFVMLNCGSIRTP
ncbi:hypothetical protein ALC57_10494 [Trachymyrmex cornetzi]|uniref:Uncharacterized protein n=1 Tax=Trachymyrmex cornetzi TaxID=471704 RepID=A0A195DXD7_9HYME|nr:hypothetical protein ALC57_10494 [Trachymyrmex cornetzi]